MTGADEQLVHTALSSPAFHGLAEAIEVVHTPCSTIYLAGSHALKVKKPVDLAYLDFRSLAARRAASEADLALNRDLAPGVYQRVDAIVRDPAAPLGVRLAPLDETRAKASEVLAFAVHMRRLPRAGMMDELLGERDLTRDEAAALAHTLAAFHARAPRDPSIAAFGAPEAVEREMQDNAAQLVQACTQASAPLSRPLLAHLTTWLRDEAVRKRALIQHRAARGYVREGHGDLHAGNVCFDRGAASPANPLGLVIYDRLEFRRDFRCRDIAAEVASLAASCEGLGRWASAERFTSAYVLAANDGALLALQNVWRAHYALVRAKVSVLSAAGAADAGAQDQLHARARRQLGLAAACTLPPSLIISCGLPGGGKSYLAQRIASQIGAVWVRADEVRKALAGVPSVQRLSADWYTPEASARVYEAMLEQARAALDARSVVIDATLRSPAARAPFLALARELGVPALIVHAHASEPETRRRLRARAAEGADASDADERVYELLRASFVPPAPGEAPTLSAGESTPPLDTVDRVLEALVAPARS